MIDYLNLHKKEGHTIRRFFIFLVLCICSAILYNTSITEEVYAFTDVSEHHWASDTIEWAVQNNIVNGYEDGSFKPNKVVSEAEFLVMLLRAYPEIEIHTGKTWYAGAYDLAESYDWPVLHELQVEKFNRGQVAKLIAATQGQALDTNQAIQFLLDHGLSKGKTAPTVDGYDAVSSMTRAEALKFIKNMKDLHFSLHPGVTENVEHWTLQQIELGQSEQQLLDTLGQPTRKDPSVYGFLWYIYHKGTEHYAMIGVQDGQVVAMGSNADLWQSPFDLQIGSTYQEVLDQLGLPLDYILKGNMRYMLHPQRKEELVYHYEDAYVTLFLDIHQNHQIMGILVVDEKVEEDFIPTNVTYTDELREAMEQQVFELANVARQKHGLESFQWHIGAAEMARGHSQHMAQAQFFAHVSPDGTTLKDRLEQKQIAYLAAAENIAAGQQNAMYVHAAWMNSSGHRSNLLGDYSHLGVGIHFGGEMRIYYTQNFVKSSH